MHRTILFAGCCQSFSITQWGTNRSLGRRKAVTRRSLENVSGKFLGCETEITIITNDRVCLIFQQIRFHHKLGSRHRSTNQEAGRCLQQEAVETPWDNCHLLRGHYVWLPPLQQIGFLSLRIFRMKWSESKCLWLLAYYTRGFVKGNVLWRCPLWSFFSAFIGVHRVWGNYWKDSFF